MATATRRTPWLAALFGLLLAVALAKFGNPVIFKSMEESPANVWEVLLANWPVSWSAPLLGVIALISFPTIAKRLPLVNRAVVALMAAWLFWVILSLKGSIAPELSRITFIHFAATAGAFCLGAALLPTLLEAQVVFKILLIGMLFSLWMGFDQHYGGLEAAREAFYKMPNWQSFPQEYKLKVASDRIFGPFVYPNTFAGALLIWTPVLTLAIWDWTKNLPSIVRKVLVGLFSYSSVACFFWTGSKAGWLIAIAMFVAALLHLNLKRATRIGIIVAVLAVGLAGFALKFRSYLEKGATSASARTIYWKAAVQIANEHPIFGAGPGTFAKTFAPIKPPEAEMARLVHNDYLEQACDSGWPAFLLFVGFIGLAMVLGHEAVSKSAYHFAVWIGLIGWALQSCVEFGLYIPAISWSAFAMLGWLLASRIAIDTPPIAKVTSAHASSVPKRTEPKPPRPS
jgi:O-antigen ligase